MLDPEVTLNATLDPSSTNFVDQEELNATLRDAGKDAEDELDDYEFFPVVSLGINYAF